MKRVWFTSMNTEKEPQVSLQLAVLGAVQQFLR